MNYPETIYYKDELNDEFSKGGITPIEIDENYRYEGTVLRPVARGFFYHFLAKTIGTLILKIGFGHRIVGKEKFKVIGKSAYYLYGNHTNPIPDAFIPTIINITKSTFVIVHPDNVSMPVLGKITPSLGAVPLPNGMKAYKNYSSYLDRIADKNRAVAIYPEAHIWPYYTHIRPFKADSFHYPVKYDVPVFCFTNTYQKRLFFKKPRMVTYIDGPFYPDTSLSKPERVKKLREQVYSSMTEASKNNTVEFIKYIKVKNNAH